MKVIDYDYDYETEIKELCQREKIKLLIISTKSPLRQNWPMTCARASAPWAAA